MFALIKIQKQKYMISVGVFLFHILKKCSKGDDKYSFKLTCFAASIWCSKNLCLFVVKTMADHAIYKFNL